MSWLIDTPMSHDSDMTKSKVLLDQTIFGIIMTNPYCCIMTTSLHCHFQRKLSTHAFSFFDGPECSQDQKVMHSPNPTHGKTPQILEQYPLTWIIPFLLRQDTSIVTSGKSKKSEQFFIEIGHPLCIALDKAIPAGFKRKL